ncbi:hypothetical protein [Roseivirga sp.]|uniref:hypothetical protein n=1 Tax=Roseivirga sp. TaxID=1964215 RepID=UPI003B523BC8
MRKVIFLFIASVSGLGLMAQISSTSQLLDAMQVKHRNHWFKTFTFEQETIRYSGGAARDTSIWNEAILYPDRFRIDYGEPGRFVIFRNDSAYRFSQSAFQSKRLEPQEFLLFKGGMYFMPAYEVSGKLKNYGYDTSLFREDRFNGQRVYVVGAKEGDLKAKQFWVNADHFYIVRRISALSDGRVLDVQYSDHKKFEGGWVEQKVIFYLQEQLIQIEKYLNIEVGQALSEQIFEPENPKMNWWK